jgi:acetyltransferase
MQTFFYPDAVAVIGASAQNLGNFVVKNLVRGFKGAIYPVNPNYAEIEGLPCFASIADIPGNVDLAIVLVPAAAVPAVLNACALKGTRRVIIESAGFAESGQAGVALQAQCVAIARAAGIRLWGPNCMGIVDVCRQHFFTFMHPGIRAEGLLPGRISLIVQSGMMSAVFLAELARRGIGVAKACSIGNRADVDECDLLAFLQQDADTDVIAMYLESIPRGRRFARLAQSSTKPIVLLKGGQSQAGALAAMSHTHSLSGNSRLLNSVMTLSGVTLADSVYQMMEMAEILAAIPRINPQSRTAIITLSGGAGILACDALDRAGIPVATLSDHTTARIGQIFPSWMPVYNPIDLFPAVSMHGRKAPFEIALAAVLDDAAVDAIVVHFVAGLDESVPDLQALKKTADRAGKALIFWLMGRKEGNRRFREQARAAGIAVQDDAIRIAQGLAAVSRFTALQAEGVVSVEPARNLPSAVDLPSVQTTWDEFDSKRLLAEWDIPVVTEQLVADPEQAWQAACRIGMPVVLKGLAPGMAHKTEHGLVKLGLSDQNALHSAFDTLQRQMNGQGRILIQQQVARDYEVIAGFIRDDQFGACVMFGIGGILAELEPDVMFALAPLGMAAARKLMQSLRNRRLMQGFRGLRPIDEARMAAILVQLGRMGTTFPRIAQIDINPVVISDGNPLAVDANIVFRENAD